MIDTDYISVIEGLDDGERYMKGRGGGGGGDGGIAWRTFRHEDGRDSFTGCRDVSGPFNDWAGHKICT